MTSLERSASMGLPDVRWSKRVGVQRYLRLLARLSRMTPGEAAARVIQIPLRRLAASRSRASGSKSRQAWPLGRAVSGVPLREWLAARLDERFFFGPAFRRSLQAPAMRDALAGSRVVEMARLLGTEGLDILGQQVRLVPGQINWHADPRSNRDAWSRTGFDEDAAIRNEEADVKYVWEVNRQQYLTLLGRAFWQTGDPRLARHAVALIDDWISANPPGRGVNWSSHLEVSMRALSWLWTMPYLAGWPGLDDRFLERWLESLAEHHRHLATNLSIYTDPTNHLIGEATGLWMLSTVFPEMPDAATQRVRTIEILAREIGRQIAPDGVNREQATSYQRFVLDFLLQILALGRRVREPLPQVFHDRAQAALTFVSALIGRRGDVPMIGDSDDARGVPLPERVGWDFRDLLSTGAALFSRPDWKAQAGSLAEPTIWLLGDSAADAFHGLGDAPAAPSSTVFADGGYCVFKAETPALRGETIFDVGPLGLLPNAAHGHADALSVMIRVNDELLLADPGTGTYFTNKGVRDWFRSTAAHNTLTIDDLDQADRFDVFKWVNPMRVGLLTSFTGRHVDYAVGRHDGYSRLRKAVTHRRHVLFVHPGSWIIVDCVDGSGDHLITSRYHFEPGTRLEQTSCGSFLTASPSTGSGLRFTFAEHGEPGTRVSSDELGFWSERYGSWRNAPQLSVATNRSTPALLCTFISAVAAGQASSSSADADRIVTCQVERRAGAGFWRAKRQDGGEHWILENPAAERISLPDGRVSTASFLFVRQSPDGADILTFESARSGNGHAGRRLVCQERSAPSHTLQV